MRLEGITAIPHPSGNRIDLKWINPDPAGYPGVRVVRRKKTHPVLPTQGDVVLDGIIIAPGTGNPSFSPTEDKETEYTYKEHTYTEDDKDTESGKRKGSHLLIDIALKAETVYYYSLFPYYYIKDGNGPPKERRYYIDKNNRAIAMASGPYNMTAKMYDLLPGIYKRYDNILPDNPPASMSEEDKQRGQLDRFLDLPGSQLDLLYSFTRAILDLHDLYKTDGRLLPLLAQWIGWELDYRKEIADQRNEIKNAPSLYKRIGLIPTIEATVKRLFGWEKWEFHTKEFVHNIFLSNTPERLNIWIRKRGGTGEWTEPTEPLSLNFAYEGRPAAVRDVRDTDKEVVWLFYHTLRSYYPNERDAADQDSATNAQGKKDAVSPSAGHSHTTHTRPVCKKKWDIWYKTCEKSPQLNEAEFEDWIWSPSRPLTKRVPMDKYPAAVIQGKKLFVFWSAYDEKEKRWYISYKKHISGMWSEIRGFRGEGVERKKPWAVSDKTECLWLFWLERETTAMHWQIKYKCFHNEGDDSEWELTPAYSLTPVSEEPAPTGESDPFIIYCSTDSLDNLWVFWARKESVADSGGSPVTPGSSGAAKKYRWRIVYRLKRGINGDINDGWSKLYTLPGDDGQGNRDDRDPAAFFVKGPERRIDLFWSSNRSGSWSIWQSRLDLNWDDPSYEPDYHDWDEPQQVTKTPYSQRYPLPMMLDNDLWISYRTNRSLKYQSSIYLPTETIDFRYAGCTTVDPGNVAKNALCGRLEDFQTYTYDTGKYLKSDPGPGQKGKHSGKGWYGRGSVGVYLIRDIEDTGLFIQNPELVEYVLKQFLPVQVRAKFIIEPFLYPEEKVALKEIISDEIRCISSEETASPIDTYTDTVPEWIWLRSTQVVKEGGIVSEVKYNDHATVIIESNDLVKNTNFRTWHIGVTPGGLPMKYLKYSIKGFYRDILRGKDGEIISDSGWSENTIMNGCRIMLARFMKNDFPADFMEDAFLENICTNGIEDRKEILKESVLTNGIQYLAVGQGKGEWDQPDGYEPPDPSKTGLENPCPDSPIPVSGENLNIVYMDGDWNETDGPKDRLQITATLQPGYPSPLPSLNSYPLREFALFGKYYGVDYMVNCVRHPVIHKDASATLIRTIRLDFSTQS